jgi:chromosome segregation ATPase
MAAVQSHAVEVQKAALAYEQQANEQIERAEAEGARVRRELDETKTTLAEAEAQLDDTTRELQSSDDRIRNLLGGNPSDPRTEIVRLRMQICTHDGVVARYVAKLQDTEGRLQGVSSALKHSTTEAAETRTALAAMTDSAGKLVVAENMAKLLEDEARALRNKVSKEVTARAQAEAELCTLRVDHKFAKKQVDELAERLAQVDAARQIEKSSYGGRSASAFSLPPATLRAPSPAPSTRHGPRTTRSSPTNAPRLAVCNLALCDAELTLSV